MGGWDVRRVQLGEPYTECWVEPYLDPPMGMWLDFREAALTAKSDPSEPNADRLLAVTKLFVADHNLTDRDGAPLEVWTARTVGPKLTNAIRMAIESVLQDEGGATADPLPNRTTRRAASHGRGSPAPRSPRNTRSGGSRAA